MVGFSVVTLAMFLTSFMMMAVFLYLPGFLLLRSTRQTRMTSLFFAPAMTLACYGVYEIILSSINIRGSWLTIVLPITLVCIVAYATSLILHNNVMKKTEKQTDTQLDAADQAVILANKSATDTTRNFLNRAMRSPWSIAGLYVVISAVIVLIIFLVEIGGLSTYSQLYDNAWHMSIIRKFLTTGDYSTLHSGDIIATVGSKFYPTGWHSLMALTASATGASIPVVINAGIVLILTVVYPTSMFVLARMLFQKQQRFVMAMSLTPLLFAIFPWRFLVFGSLYSNLLSFAILPLAIALCIKLLHPVSTLRSRLATFAMLLIALVGIAVTQPNSVFTMGVLVAPYLFYCVPQYVSQIVKDTKKRTQYSCMVMVLLLVAIVVVWFGLYKASFMQRTVTWQWPAIERKIQAGIDVLFVGFHNAEPQICLGILVIIGIIYTLFHREYLWMSCAYGIMCILYMLAAASDGRAKAVLTGFWYHDSYRLGASAVFFGAALAALGMCVCFDIICNMSNIALADYSQVHNRKLLVAVLSCVLLLINYFPSHYLSGSNGSVVTAFGAVVRDVRFWNRPGKPKSYDAQESAFVQKVLKIVPQGSLVLNQPYDGSVYAWGVDGLNVYYKAWEGNWMGAPTEDNTLIATRLNRIYEDPQVCAAVAHTKAKYLLLLNRSDYQVDESNPNYMKSMYASYEIAQWKGIDRVRDTTPGFKPILTEGTMRLYKITADCNQ